jgi:DNA-binding transcriptional regulator YdaS (Cro superfamily)
MDINELVKQYGSQTALAKALGVTRAAVSLWVVSGRMPKGRVWQIQAGAIKPPEKPLQPISGKGKGKVASKE